MTVATMMERKAMIEPPEQCDIHSFSTCLVREAVGVVDPRLAYRIGLLSRHLSTEPHVGPSGGTPP
ncbi:hypothetical protein BH23ACT9_BH23ACT9_15060 [soil metagenome]